MPKVLKLDISDIETSAYQNFLDYIRNEKTRTKYSNDLKKFLDLIPDKICGLSLCSEKMSTAEIIKQYLQSKGLD